MKKTIQTVLSGHIRTCASVVLIVAGFGIHGSWATTEGTLVNIGLRNVYAQPGQIVRVPVVLSYYSDEDGGKIESVAFRLELGDSQGYRIRCMKGPDAGRGEWRISCELQAGGPSVEVFARSREPGPGFEFGTQLIYQVPVEIGQAVSVGDSCPLRLSNIRVSADNKDLGVSTTAAAIHIVDNQNSCDFYHGVFSVLDRIFYEETLGEGASISDYDVDGDGILSMSDAVYLSLHEAALIGGLPVCAATPDESFPRVIEGKTGEVEILPPEHIHSFFYKYRLIARNVRGLIGADISLGINDGFVWDGPKNSQVPFHQLKAGADSSGTRYRIVFTTNLAIDTDEDIEVFEMKVQQNTDKSVFSSKSFTYYVLDTVPLSTQTRVLNKTRKERVSSYYTFPNSRIRVSDMGSHSSAPRSYTIFDLHGRTIQEGPLYGGTITLSIPPTQYLVRIHGDHEVWRFPLVVTPK